MLIDDAVFTVFDFETTGLYPYAGDKICEVGALRFDVKSRKPRNFHCLVDPERDISPEAFRVNGITNDMVSGKRLFKEVLPDFLTFIEGSVLVAYNAGFDVGFLASSIGPSANELLSKHYIIDALKLARILFPDIGRYTLSNVASELNIESAIEHRALSDATMTWKLFKKELLVLKQNGVSRIEEIDRFRMAACRAPGEAMDSNIRLFDDAIRSNRRLEILYRSLWTNRSTRRIITPKEIRHSHDYSYIVAYCHLRQEQRAFRLDCIMSVDIV